MDKRILYPRFDDPENPNALSIVIPSPRARLTFTVTSGENTFEVPETDEQLVMRIAFKDVPKGVPFKIVDVSDIPTDRTFRNAWELSTEDFDGEGADYGVGGSHEVHGYDNAGNPILVKKNP